MNKISNFKYSLTFYLFLSCLPTILFGQSKAEIEQNFYKVSGIVLPENIREYKKVYLGNINELTSSFIVTYVHTRYNSSKLIVSIYPADIAIENRALDEHISNINSTYVRLSELLNQPIIASKDSINIIGVLSTFLDNETNNNVALATFEAGRYFIKYEVKSKTKSTKEIISLTKALIDTISPINILKNNPLILGITMHVAPGIVQDTNCLDPILQATLTKIDWVNKNVDSLERCSGFPSLYLLEQKLTIEAMLTEWESTPRHKSKLDGYFSELIKIRNSGFLDEYIYQEYEQFLLVPDNQELKIKDYARWKKSHKISVRLRGPISFYILGYEESYKNLKE